MDEKMRILKMVEEGKITAEEYHKRVYENGKDVID